MLVSVRFAVLVGLCSVAQVCLVSGDCLLPCKDIKNKANDMLQDIRKIGVEEAEKKHEVWWPDQYVVKYPPRKDNHNLQEVMKALINRVAFAQAMVLAEEPELDPNMTAFTINLMKFVAGDDNLPSQSIQYSDLLRRKFN